MNQAQRVYPVEMNPTGPFPLLIGLEGPPGGGKTFSALRLARGIQQVRGGPIRLIDTEAGRSAAYRAQIDFGLVRLDPPYRPTRFLSAIQELIQLDAPSCIIVDSFSDEHEGEGGVLEWHEEEVTRRLGKDKDNWARREAMSMAGWIVPKAARTRLVSGILRITTPVIFTFRAREKTRPIRDPQTSKTVPTKLGYVAIAPAEVCHAMTAMCLLPPHAEGKPVWRSEEVGQDFLLKRPNFLTKILTDAQLDEPTGVALAQWAQGFEVGAEGTAIKMLDSPEYQQAQAAATRQDNDKLLVARLEAMLMEAAAQGYVTFARAWNLMTKNRDWRGLDDDWRRHLRGQRDQLWMPMARDVDAKQQQSAEEVAHEPADAPDA